MSEDDDSDDDEESDPLRRTALPHSSTAIMNAWGWFRSFRCEAGNEETFAARIGSV